MNPDSPFTVHGDETLEARIVAWVLGEASAFEEAELERLCEERPELLVFRHRMRALHGLLTEAEKQQPDEGWKLPEEKRKVLDEILGETKVVKLEAEKETRVRHTGRKILLAIAACVVIGFVVLSSMPQKYESVATFEVRPRTPGLAASGSNNTELSGARSMSPQFFGTEFEIIKSRNCLEKVVDNLNLQSRWNVDKDAAVAKLKGMVDASHVKGTDLISIRVRDSKPDDVKDITEEVARSYKVYREGLERKDEEAQLAKLRKAVQAQEDKVEERRKVLSTIVRTKGIVYKGSDSFYNDGEIAQDQGAKNALQMYHQLEQEKIQLDSQINSLLKYDNDQLMTYASGLDLPENNVKNLYPQYLEAKRQLEAQKINGQGDRHPTVLAAEDTVERMKKQLDEGIVNLRATLKAKLDLTNDRFETVKSMKDDTRDDAIRRGLDAQDYVDAKREFETDQELLQQMKLKLIGEDTSAEMQRETVKIHEKPVEAKKVGPLQSIFGLFGNRESQPNAELADAKTVRFSSPAPASVPAPAQSESSELLASRSLEAAKAKTVPLRPEFTPELIEGTPKPIILPPIADTSAEDNLTVQPQSTDRAARSRISDSTGEVSAIAGKLDSVRSAARVKRVAAEGATNQPAIPAPADTPAAMPSLSSLGDRIEISSGSIVAESKPESGDSLGLAAGKKGEAPAQPATAAPAASDAETDLAKLMSGGTIATDGGAGGGFITEESKSFAGMVSPDYTFGFSTRGAGSNQVSGYYSRYDSDADPFADAGQVPSISSEQAGNSSVGAHLWDIDTSNISADAEYDAGFSTGRLPTLAQGSHDGWESAKAAEFGRKVPEVRFAGESEAPPPSLSDSEVAQSVTNGNRSGDLATSRKTIDAVLNFSRIQNGEAKGEGDRTTTVETIESAKPEDAVRKNLYIAEGNLNLGKYDDAMKSYEDVLRADPYNTAARRGLERLSQAKSDYYRAAYDHTRAELLSEVDAAWEIAVPEEQAKAEGERETLAKPSEPKTQDEGIKTRAPAVTPAIPDLTRLIEEVAASEEPYSTFSLNISDASFQIAQAAMAKGERPDPAGVKVEQFYNAVDYGDPAPAAGEPVAVNIEQSAHPVIPGRNLVRVALKTAAAGRAASQPLHLTLLVDQSGSMSREDRRTAMKQALGSLGGLLSNNDSVTVVGFSRTPRMLADGLSGDQSKKLPDLINVEASEGGTNLEEAMKLGEQLAARHKQPGAQNRIVLFTDGAANLGNADPEKLAERVKQLRQKGIALDIAGIAAADLNDELLAELARNGNGRYYVVGKGDDENFAKQLAGAFRPAAENVKVQVRFNPERVSRYKLIGFEKDRLKTEDFRNDAVDAAEMAAEEAGVAIYQIETIADGRGEIGEVSVRFRDTAAGQMVERTWAISNDPSTPAFDRASPSMQLATFAMLTAEKLKGGAYAEAIDFNQLSAPQANVKQFYGDQGRPAEVLRMVDALK